MSISRRTFISTASALVVPPAPDQTKALVIDAHSHAGHGEAMLAADSTFLDPEITLRHMSEVGIDRTIIFPGENAEYEKPNQEIADICGRHPGKFIGFAKHDPKVERGRIRAMLRHEVESLGLKGLKLAVHPTREVLDAVAELGIPILYHPEKVGNYEMIAEAYPQINYILPHLGSWGSFNHSEHMAAIDAARRYPNVYVDSSWVCEFRYLELAAKDVPDKLIFGSDGPETDSRVELYKIRVLKLPPAVEAQVLGGTVSKLLPKGSI